MKEWDGKKRIITRRDFIKKTATGAALAYAGMNAPKLILGPGAKAQSLDDFRVIKIHNPSMATHEVDGWANQNNAINESIVRNSLDTALMCLTNTTSVQDGWAAIVPPSPAPSSAKIAIKVNFISIEHLSSHTVFVEWVVDGLVDLGIQASNIYVYDERGLDSLRASMGNPPEIHFGNFNRAGDYDFTGHSNCRLTSIIHDDTVDWIINIAVPKTHGSYVANFTMSLKNHYGTFDPASHSSDPYLAEINTHPKIANKQILVILDAIWGSHGCCSSTYTWMNKILMGKKAISVDYWAARDIIETPEAVGNGGMGSAVGWPRVQAWFTEGNFGITWDQVQNSALFIENCSTDTVPPKAPTNLIITPS